MARVTSQHNEDTSLGSLSPAEVAALAHGGFRAATELGEDPLARTQEAYETLVSASLSEREAADLLGVASSEISERLTKRMLYGIKLPSGWRLPTFQFDGRQTVPGLEAVVPRLDPELHPIEVVTWFTLPDPDLLIDEEVVSPRDWLRQGGDPAAVAEIAADL